MSFWDRLPRPIYALAPLADVTDAAFRRLIAKYSSHKRRDGTIGGPDVFWTEFVSADGLMLAPRSARERLLADFMYTKEERPIIAQLFSSNPDTMEAAAKLCRELGFDGIDINMGCPDRSIEKQGAGAAMMKNPERALEIIVAVKRGAGGLPVSVKTRIGYSKDETETWIPALLGAELAAITIHARTRKEMSKVLARWGHVRRAVELRDELQHGKENKTLILGNGDALSLADGRQRVADAGADGVMFGRAIFGNPWFFNPEMQYEDISVPERLHVLCEHTQLFEELLPFKNFSIMKKHYKAYVQGFDGAKELRTELMEQDNSTAVAQVVNRFLKQSSSIHTGSLLQ